MQYRVANQTTVEMKAVLLFCAFVAFIYARPDPKPQLQGLKSLGASYILRYKVEPYGYGGYLYHVDTSDGFHHGELAEPKQPKPEEPLTVNSYIGPDGVNYTVENSADENGFRAAGKHISKAADIGEVGNLGIPPHLYASAIGGGLG